MEPMIIDGSFGEGGGQILRSSLALSMITGRPFELHSIRAGRKTPGLRKQHLTCVKAAAEICGAEITGAAIGSSRITFSPGTVKPGEYSFATGSAGSAMLVFQTLFPVLIIQDEPTHLTLQGGTHNLMAPPAEFITRSFLGTLKRAGVDASLKLNRYGYYPAGGGEVEISVHPSTLHPFHLNEISEPATVTADSVVIRKPRSVADVQEKEVREIFPEAKVTHHYPPAVGPGNHVTVTVHRNEIDQVFTGFGKKGIDPAVTARVAAKRAESYIESGVACDAHLADQLLIPMYLAGGGSFTCGKPSLHATTNAEVIRLFTGAEISFREMNDYTWICEYSG